MVVCGEPSFQFSGQQTLTNPMLIVEVFSPETEASDRGRKFIDYRRLPSLREYVMVAQTEPRVEVYRPNRDGHWTLFESVGLEPAVTIESVGVQLPMLEIYRGVEFEPEPPQSA